MASVMTRQLTIDTFRAVRVDKRSPTPVYAQIASGIRSVLEAAAPAPGTLLPPERILCDHFGVSRMTLRQAYALLARDGIIETERGRGTLVASPRLIKQQQQMRSFTEEIRARGGTPSSRLVYFRRTEPGAEAREFFQISEREQVFEIQRVRYNNGMPLALETVQIPCRLCPGLEQHDLTSRSLYQILEETYGLQLTHCVEEIFAARAKKTHRALLGLPQSGTVLIIKRRTYSGNQTPAELAVTEYRGDSWAVIVRSVRGGR